MNFQTWLTENTTLSERTILNYSRTIDRFLDRYDEVTIENINNFISKVNRNTRTTYIKYAFKYYLVYIGKDDEYVKVVKIKIKPRKKTGTYLENNILLNIVFNIEDEIYRLVALLQYITGLRADDVLDNTWRNFKENTDGSLTMTIKVKRGKEHTVFIPKKYSERITYFVETCGRKYPFLRGESDTHLRLVNNNYRYYWNAVKKSAKDLGYEKFSTHDFRRNFLEDVFMKTRDPRIAQNLAGHSSMIYTMKYLKSHEDEGKLKKVVEELRG
ncbi:MAG: tyrosine-type recombinase/integrase [Candidatus Heimdallarchaeaceae archaeon]